jgi:hypothetical protein
MALTKFILKPISNSPLSKWGWFLMGSEEPLGEGRKKSVVMSFAIKVIRKEGGSLRIMGRNGRFQEERTYPRSADPKRSKG